jgi:hypothetical protein
MAEWSKDHMVDIGSIAQHFGLVDGTWLNWRLGGTIRGKWRQLVGKVGEWYVASRHLQGCSPRLCRLRTDGLAPVRKYWTYRSHAGDIGPVNLVAGCQQKLDFSHCFISCYGREARYRPADWSVGVLWIVSTTLLLGAVDPFKSIDDCAKGYYMWTTYGLGSYTDWAWIIRMVLNHTWTERGKHVACWSSFPLQGVHQFESSQLLDMSNRMLNQVAFLLSACMS